jgi:hypothetical protein
MLFLPLPWRGRVLAYNWLRRFFVFVIILFFCYCCSYRFLSFDATAFWPIIGSEGSSCSSSSSSSAISVPAVSSALTRQISGL